MFRHNPNQQGLYTVMYKDIYVRLSTPFHQLQILYHDTMNFFVKSVPNCLLFLCCHPLNVLWYAIEPNSSLQVVTH